MQKKRTSRVWKWLEIAVIVYILCGVAFYFLQDKLLFHPQKLSPDHVFKFDIPFKEIYVPVNNEKNLSIIQFTVPDSVCKGVVLYFHGNRKNIERYAPFATNFTKHNYEVWMIDYPGFGKSTGKRNEESLYDDAALFYQMARSRFSKDSIILYGKSLGTGICAQLAASKDCKRLILETPYYSIDAMFSHYAFMYPVSMMVKYHFPVYDYLERVSVPITIFHGTNDEVIPYTQATRLLAIAQPGSELVTIEKGKHNNLNDFPLFHEKLDSILSQ